MITSILIALAAIGLDQLTKYWVRTDLRPVGDIPLWDGVFHFHYAENTGAAFSMLSGHSIVFFILTCTVVVGLLVYLIRHRKGLNFWLKLPLGLIMGGAIGNLIDRTAYGYVIDFLYFKLINFAIFNVADCCLVIGCILLAIYILFLDGKKIKKEAASAAEEKETDGEGTSSSEG